MSFIPLMMQYYCSRFLVCSPGWPCSYGRVYTNNGDKHNGSKESQGHSLQSRNIKTEISAIITSYGREIKGGTQTEGAEENIWT
jgi:hypothetical protein